MGNTVSRVVQQSDWFSSPWFPSALLYQTGWFILMWILSAPAKNAGLVDFAWPFGFSCLSLLHLLTGKGNLVRRILINSMYLLCGLRFNFGWIMRTKYHGEDKRWNLWRERWSKGEGWFGIKNHMLNFFAFYQAQNLATVLFMTVPAFLASNNEEEKLHPIEILAIVLWVISFALENVADSQLAKWQRLNRKNPQAVCDVGLWKYSRHPNYFFEFMIWVSYTLFGLCSVKKSTDTALLMSIPPIAYYFLVHFTGVPLTEKGSLLKRGEVYRRYQEATNMFFPWFPKDVKKTK